MKNCAQYFMKTKFIPLQAYWLRSGLYRQNDFHIFLKSPQTPASAVEIRFHSVENLSRKKV